ncbi:MAG: NifB/NifX family molybdenum-iron cluster-binding protein [Candidatus Omnitrophica bacterium]|jgi:predicted Fe-Mo cluster-binding NifX family protein|nr:NifB/NifX family molybdenum-iron cluster-binding protein [Candidatus Omnitrophota bacterium]MDD5078503.1 NifB/NifX family molybdenum-iron cluster-binding protein [Candidatus Omnitrophota bacterium]MDD5725277.1 NifB/NifX family molybdenum-iron cluster-binding protein [Candidatus Omnitrophota bacterium]
MKICITSEGDTLDSRVDPRFGRCRNFIFFDTESGEFQARENSSAGFQGGAGIQSGQLVVSQGVKAVLTGNVGPNAYQVLSAAGINVFTGVSGTVREAVQGLREGKYKAASDPSVGSKFGMPGK